MKILVTQSFGRESEYKRVILSVLSFWALYSGPRENIRVILGTDKPAYFSSYFEGLPVEYIVLTPEKIKVMRGEIDFIHRMKIALIDESFQRYSSADMLYVDSDTLFLKDPLPLVKAITGNDSFMHLVEFEYEAYKDFAMKGFGEANHIPFIQFLDSTVFTTTYGQESFHSLVGWNAGVMGLPTKVAGFLPDVYSLTDEFYKAAPLNGSEQAAFSYILQTRTNLRACEEYVYHYWGVFKKQVIDAALPKMLDESFAKLPLSKRLQKVAEIIVRLPLIVKIHEQALHELNSKNYKLGYKYTVQALSMAPTSRHFVKHIFYHIKRHMLSLF